MISQFNGAHIDYFRFWYQFETQSDKSELSSVTKLPYLKEIVIPKVRLLIDGLLRKTKGYLENQVNLGMLIFRMFYQEQYCNCRNKSSSN